MVIFCRSNGFNYGYKSSFHIIFFYFFTIHCSFIAAVSTKIGPSNKQKVEKNFPNSFVFKTRIFNIFCCCCCPRKRIPMCSVIYILIILLFKFSLWPLFSFFLHVNINKSQNLNHIIISSSSSQQKNNNMYTLYSNMFRLIIKSINNKKKHKLKCWFQMHHLIILETKLADLFWIFYFAMRKKMKFSYYHRY